MSMVGGRARWVWMVVVAVALVATACGGDDDDASGSSIPATSSTLTVQSDGAAPISTTTAPPLPSVAPADGCTGDRAVEVMTCPGLTNNHVDEPTYPFEPPVGGDHYQVWANCGLYLDTVIPDKYAVHSMEHGAVWIVYGPDRTEADINALTAMVQHDPKLLVSAMADPPAPFVVSAWGAQRYLSSLQDPALQEFIAQYQEADTAPEPTNSCAGGAGQPDVAA